MSNLTSYVQTYQGSAPIGGIVDAYVSTTTGPTTTNSGTWVLSNNVYTQSSYPELYSAIGLMGASVRTTSTAVTRYTPANGLVYGNGIFVSSQGANSNVRTSTDGVTWTNRAAPIVTNALTYGAGIFVLGTQSGGALATSTDAITWTSRTSGTASNINILLYANSLFIYAGSGGALATSTDAITWTARTSGTASAINSLTYGGGIYVYGGAGGVLATSTDAITWTAGTSGTTSLIYSLIYANSLYVYSGAGGVLATSTNAITWTSRYSGTSNIVLGLIYENSLFTYCGSLVAQGLATSTDAITWKSVPTGATFGINAIVYNGAGTYVYGENANFSYTATNLTTPTTTLYNTATEFLVPQLSYFTSVSDSAIQNVYIRAK